MECIKRVVFLLEQKLAIYGVLIALLLAVSALAILLFGNKDAATIIGTLSVLTATISIHLYSREKDFQQTVLSLIEKRLQHSSSVSEECVDLMDNDGSNLPKRFAKNYVIGRREISKADALSKLLTINGYLEIYKVLRKAALFNYITMERAGLKKREYEVIEKNIDQYYKED